MPRTLRRSLLAAVALLASLALCHSASAATITYSDGFASAPIPFASNPLASVQQFDTTLGTLTSFSLELVANTDSGQITYTDTSGLTTDIISLGIGATVTATAPSSITLVAVPLQTGSDPSLAPFGMFSVTGGAGTASDTFGPDSTPGDFGPYETVGVGFFNVNVGAALAIQLITSGGSGNTSPTNGETNGTMYATYNYTPVAVPEPATLSMLGIGLIGLAGTTWARRRRAA